MTISILDNMVAYSKANKEGEKKLQKINEYHLPTAIKMLKYYIDFCNLPVKNTNIENNSNNVQETQKSDFVADVVDIEEKANVDIEVNRENLDEIKSSKMDAIIGNYIKNIKKSDNNIEEEIENNNDISNNKYVINFKNKIEEGRRKSL